MILPLIAIGIVSFVIEGIALTKLAKVKPVKNLCLIWIPFACIFGRLNVISQMSDKEDFRFLPWKNPIKNRSRSVVSYLCCHIVLIFLSTLLLLTMWIPVLGTVEIILYTFISTINLFCICAIEISYLRDMLDYFNPGNEKNLHHAVGACIYNLFTFGLVRAIFLLRLANKQTLQKIQ